MKKIFGLIIVAGLGFFIVALYSYFTEQQKQATQLNQVVTNFEKTKNYLLKHYQGNYPIPTGDLILLDDTKTMIHLSDRNIPLNKIKNLYVIQATTCDILKNDKQFQSVAYDEINSLWKLHRCFTYAVTADRKNFQIWTIINKNGEYVAKLDGTIKDSITRSYDSPRLVKNNSSIDLPYPPKLSPVVIVDNLWKSKLYAQIINNSTFEKKKISLHGWTNYLLSSPGKYDIKIYGKLSPTTQAKFVDVVGDIVNLQWDKSGKLVFEVKDYEIKWKKKSYLASAGRFVAEVLKLAPDTDMKVSHKNTTLVIRWTKFTVSADDENFDTFLTLGHIVQLLNWQKIDLTLQKAFSLIKNNKLVNDLQKVKQLTSFTVVNDVVNNPKWNFSVMHNTSLNDILSGAKSIKKYKISYENWQKISLIVIDLPNENDKLKKILQANKNKLGLTEVYKQIEKDHGKGAARVYKNLVNNICKANLSKKWLDISKLWYLLTLDKDRIWKLNLKSTIAEKLNLNNDYVILTSRHYNWQDSQVLGYSPKDKYWVRTISLWALNYDKEVSKLVVACNDN